ncbi:MAG: PAS domain-containing sensor histidine kinase [Ignavibacteriales bacterium]|nr:PAS domain-containing sensor histidine kinase [Ignavibacteriales bacterium]
MPKFSDIDLSSIKLHGTDDQSLAKSKLFLHTFNSISECISITDMNDMIIYVNKSFAVTYGYDVSELIGKHVEILRSGKNDPEILKEILPKTIQEGWRGRIWNKRKNGEEFLIELYTTIVRDEKERPLALVGVARDLTKQLEAEEKLADAQNKYKNLFHQIKAAIYESTPDGKLIDLNPAGMELLGIKSRDQLEKIDVARDFYINAKDRTTIHDEVEKSGYVKDYELSLKNLNNEIIIVRETSTAIKDKSGNIIAFHGILRDITEAKRNEDKLKQLVEKLEYVNNQLHQSEEELKNTNATKDKFFSIIAHDLRSPFSSLLSFSEFLVEDIETLEKAETKLFAEKIHEAAQNVFALLENLLQWSRIQSGKIPYNPANFNITFKINQVVKLLSNNAERKNIKILNECLNGLNVFADDDMLSSVIQNLLSNAIKFSNNGGTIVFRSKILQNENEISITDNGVGMKEEDLKKLFRLDTHLTTYGTNDEKGSGLGLLLCQEMIERNRGKITVESKLGEGTTFSFTLPKA